VPALIFQSLKKSLADSNITKIAAQNPDGYFFKLYLLSRTVVQLSLSALFLFYPITAHSIKTKIIIKTE
ncbi:hypothetical protein, partial [Bacteroides acidifaciens]|uniref:hypothetical protein n=1 Tax=Bacteroides acidifaciens TaxID=85831 RepID=UPI002714A4D3